MDSDDVPQEDMLPLVSIICPIFNEEDAIPLFFARLKCTLQPLELQYHFELIFTNNGSTDGSVERILQIRKDHPFVQLITLSRNFGYQASLISGLTNATGDVFIVIDVDCEDPPEMIPIFLEGWREGYDVVYGQRDKRPESALLQVARKFFYRMTRSIADSDFILDMAEFSLFNNRICEVLLSNRSTFPFLRNEIGYAGFRRKAIPYERQHRVHGQTHYNLWAMTRFAIGGILSSSTFPLRGMAYCGIPLGALDVSMAATRLVVHYPQDLIPLVLANLGALTIGLAFVSIYIARIYKDQIQRPRFIVDRINTYLNGRSAIDDIGRSDQWTLEESRFGRQKESNSVATTHGGARRARTS
jgi:dolichol-phosphate mannosyltransferase